MSAGHSIRGGRTRRGIWGEAGELGRKPRVRCHGEQMKTDFQGRDSDQLLNAAERYRRWGQTGSHWFS